MKAATEQGSEKARTEAWAEIARRFVQVLEPHFREEEANLLPALAEVGAAALVERTLREHWEMHRMIAEADASRLAAFAELLRAHIRFEEQVLFEAAQRRLEPVVLDGLEVADYARW